MIDKDYIEELRILSNSDDKEERKEAKEKLAEYAQTYNIKVKKTMTFENMVTYINDEMVKLAEEMNKYQDEDQSGYSVNDIINACEVADGQIVFDDINKNVLDDVKNILIDQHNDVETKQNQPTEIVEDQQVEKHTESLDVKEYDPIQPVEKQESVDIQEHQIKEEPNTEEICDLTGFTPSFTLIGGGRGYYTCPWWIFQWIMENPDWKANPNRIPHASAIDTLKSLIYYIKRDGSVKVRETKNSQFVTLS